MDAIALVRAAGGVAVLAHPLSLALDGPELDRRVRELAASGLAGLEASYGRYSPSERAGLEALAHRHGLVATGRTDYHGTYKPDLRIGVGRGDLEVSERVLVELEGRRRTMS